MDKKPTVTTLKNEIDKLKSSFENDKEEKDTKINQILYVVDNLGTSTVQDSTHKNQEYADKIGKIENDLQQVKARFKSILDEELKKRDADWQQKYDLMVHEMTKRIDEVVKLTSVTPMSFDIIPKRRLTIKFAPLSSFAQKPSRGSEHSAGIDLRSAYEYIVPARGNKLIVTDWKIEYPEGF